MKTFSSSITIDAPASKIWSILTDGAAYPSWNPTVVKVEGTIAAGEKIKVFATISPDRAFPVKVAEFVPGERMLWSSGMPLGLFKGERSFDLRPVDGKIRFEMREVFSGLLSPLIERSIPDLQPAFDEFAGALKRAAEA
ncbi:MAG: SRPBCC domain-containing protein [Myxococcales bacterium]|nr:SRPBCC domain-containing protein [Myxococcales bacterium]MCB9567573.1 SRPBCC domain-containing protein [Myxococcales bacterium]MCB9700554.1 SRPBCC domain-containing protein [Myxococcales bacterium]